MWYVSPIHLNPTLMLRVIELACFTTSCSTQWNPTPQYLSMNEYGPLTHFNAQPTRVRILFQTYSPCGLYVKRSSIYQGWRKIGTIRRRRLRCYSPLRSQVLDLGMVEYIYVMLRAIRYGIGMCPNLPRHLYFSYHAPPRRFRVITSLFLSSIIPGTILRS